MKYLILKGKISQIGCDKILKPGDTIELTPEHAKQFAPGRLELINTPPQKTVPKPITVAYTEPPKPEPKKEISEPMPEPVKEELKPVTTFEIKQPEPEPEPDFMEQFEDMCYYDIRQFAKTENIKLVAPLTRKRILEQIKEWRDNSGNL